jgi:hypothetical protein
MVVATNENPLCKLTQVAREQAVLGNYASSLNSYEHLLAELNANHPNSERLIKIY